MLACLLLYFLALEAIQFLHDLGAVQFFNTEFLRSLVALYFKWWGTHCLYHWIEEALNIACLLPYFVACAGNTVPP